MEKRLIQVTVDHRYSPEQFENIRKDVAERFGENAVIVREGIGIEFVKPVPMNPVQLWADVYAEMLYKAIDSETERFTYKESHDLAVNAADRAFKAFYLRFADEFKLGVYLADLDNGTLGKA